MDGFSIINYKGKTILYGDYSNLGRSKEKTLRLIKKYGLEIMKYPPNSVLALTNVTNLYIDKDIINSFIASLTKTAPYEKKSAVIGVNGLTKAAYNLVIGFADKHIKSFDSELEAKEWLVCD